MVLLFMDREVFPFWDSEGVEWPPKQTEKGDLSSSLIG